MLFRKRKAIDWRAEFERIGVRRTGEVWRFASGKYSDVKYDMDRLYRDPDLYSRACSDLLKKAGYQLVDRSTMFLFPERGGIAMAFELARQSGGRAGYSIKRSDTFVVESCFVPERHQRVIFGDDVITTGGSILKTERALPRPGPLIESKVLAFANRSGKKTLSFMPEGHPMPGYFWDVQIVALIEAEEPAWSLDDPQCPEHIRKAAH